MCISCNSLRISILREVKLPISVGIETDVESDVESDKVLLAFKRVAWSRNA